jgi:hypothetical protein
MPPAALDGTLKACLVRVRPNMAIIKAGGKERLRGILEWIFY